MGLQGRALPSCSPACCCSNLSQLCVPAHAAYWRPCPTNTSLLHQAGYWRDYCELEVATNSPGAVKALFSRCLLTCLSVDLWKTYLQFIRKVGAATDRQAARRGQRGWVG